MLFPCHHHWKAVSEIKLHHWVFGMSLLLYNTFKLFPIIFYLVGAEYTSTLKEFLKHGTVVGSLRKAIVEKIPESIDVDRINQKINDEGHTSFTYSAKNGMDNSMAVFYHSLKSDIEMKVEGEVNIYVSIHSHTPRCIRNECSAYMNHSLSLFVMKRTLKAIFSLFWFNIRTEKLHYTVPQRTVMLRLSKL
jgi:hypothetical protein